MKKAQGMSMNVIVIAAIALLVLVVLAIIFITRMGTTTSNIDSCKGQCIASTGDCREDVGPYYSRTNDKCDNEDDVCCVGVGG